MSGKQNRNARRAAGSTKGKGKIAQLKVIEGGGEGPMSQFEKKVVECVTRIKDMGLEQYNLAKQIKRANTDLEAMESRKIVLDEQITRLDGEQSGIQGVLNELKKAPAPKASKPPPEPKEAKNEPDAGKPDTAGTE